MKWTAFTAIIGGLVMTFSCGDPENFSERFERKAEWAASAFHAPVLSQSELAEDPQDYLIVDTRSEEEFAVSRLPGCVNWPAYQTSELPEEVNQAAASGKPIVFYCSIGYRSGEAAMRAIRLLETQSPIYNVRGGVFQWANEDRPLEGSDRVHGFDQEWIQFLRPEKRHPL